jgi:hypothetical protein
MVHVHKAVLAHCLPPKLMVARHGHTMLGGQENKQVDNLPNGILLPTLGASDTKQFCIIKAALSLTVCQQEHQRQPCCTCQQLQCTLQQ